MRLLFLSSFYPPYELGGMDQLAFEVATRLKSRGHKISVLTSQAGVTPEEPIQDSIFRSLFLQADIHYYSMRDFFLKRRAQETTNLKELRRTIDLVQPDVSVVWNMWNLSRSLPYWAEQWLPERVAYYIASIWPMAPDIHEDYWKLPASHKLSELVKLPLRKIALSQMRRDGYPPQLAFSHTMCVSRFIRDKLVAANAIPHTSGVLYNGIDPTPFLDASCPDASPKDRVLRLLYFGSLVPIKGVHIAVDALGLLRQHGLADKIKLTILGRGHPNYTASLAARVAELDLQHHVCFKDWIARVDVPQMLKQYDAFLFTSTGPEAMARTVMEAMAAGLAVIGADIGGQQEMLEDGVNALVYPPDDATQLAKCILRLRRDSDLRDRLAEAGRKTVIEFFTLDRMTTEIETWLEEIV